MLFHNENDIEDVEIASVDIIYVVRPKYKTLLKAVNAPYRLGKDLILASHQGYWMLML